MLPVSSSPDRFTSFLSELQRRRVFRVAAVYAAVAFVIAQAADIVIPALHLPAWVLTLIVVVALLGFPLALVLAWALEVTPEGVRRTEALEPGPRPAAPLFTVASRRRLIAVAGVGAFLMAAGGVYARYRPAVDAASAESPVESIAVLPFDNMSESKENEYFSDGITEDILTHLSKIGGLRVISRTSVMQYKESNKPVKQIGQELGAGAILEGSVRRAGDRVRITAQLINARTDEHLWAEVYDRQLTDIFQIQSEIAQQIAQAMQMRLSAGERSRISKSGTENVVAYDLYLKGREYLRRPTFGPQDVRDNFAGAIALFREALQRDSAYALAYAGLAEAYTKHPEYPTELRYDSAVAFAQRAIALDPELPDGHIALGTAHFIKAEYDLMREEYHRALRLNPNHVDAIAAVALDLYSRGHLAEALRRYKRAAALEPTVAQRFYAVAFIYDLLGELDRAEAWGNKALQVQADPASARCEAAFYALKRGEVSNADREIQAMLAGDSSVWSSECAGWHELRRGNYAAAKAHFERLAATQTSEDQPLEELAYLNQKLGNHADAAELLRKAEVRARAHFRESSGRNYSYTLAKVLALQGKKDEAIRYLQQRISDGWYAYYRDQPHHFLENLRGDPRYERMMAGVKAHVDTERRKVEREGI